MLIFSLSPDLLGLGHRSCFQVSPRTSEPTLNDISSVVSASKNAASVECYSCRCNSRGLTLRLGYVKAELWDVSRSRYCQIRDAL